MPETGQLPLALVVAVGENGIIGRAGGLPWRLPSDLKRFKALTWGKPLLMGRKTYESIGRPLPGRTSVVVSADPAFRVPEGVVKAPDLPAGIAAAETAAAALGADAIMVIGGSRIFAETLPLAHALHFTRVHVAPAGDVWFPPFDPGEWREVSREGPIREAGDDAAYTVFHLERSFAV